MSKHVEILAGDMNTAHARIYTAMKVVYEQVATTVDPPLRVPLGKDALGRFETESKALAEDAVKHAALSEDLLLEGASLPTNW